jgi:hypothetical protein
MTTVAGERGLGPGDAADAASGPAQADGAADADSPDAPVTQGDDAAATAPQAAVPAAVSAGVSDAPPAQTALQAAAVPAAADAVAGDAPPAPAALLADAGKLDPAPAALAEPAVLPVPAALPERDAAARRAAPAGSPSRLRSGRRAPARAPSGAAARAATLPDSEPEPQAVLPLPPTEAEKYAYVRRHQWLLTLCALVCFPPVIYTQYAIIRATGWYWLLPPFLLFTIMIMLMVAIDGFSRGFNIGEHKRIVAAWKPERYPSVDVFLPVCGEPVDVVWNTWKHVAIMAHHYPGEVTAYVLDDGASPELKKLAQAISGHRRDRLYWF